MVKFLKRVLAGVIMLAFLVVCAAGAGALGWATLWAFRTALGGLGFAPTYLQGGCLLAFALAGLAVLRVKK